MNKQPFLIYFTLLTFLSAGLLYGADATARKPRSSHVGAYNIAVSKMLPSLQKGSETAVKMVVTLSLDKDYPELRCNALVLLTSLALKGNEEAIEVFLELEAYEDLNLVKHTFRTLAAKGSEAIIDHAVALSRSYDERVGRFAVRVLECGLASGSYRSGSALYNLVLEDEAFLAIVRAARPGAIYIGSGDQFVEAPGAVLDTLEQIRDARGAFSNKAGIVLKRLKPSGVVSSDDDDMRSV